MTLVETPSDRATADLVGQGPEAQRPGRKRDHTRDPEILQAALEVLAEAGYERMTVEMVAARARAGKATLYRRWPSKGELIIDAVACLRHEELAADRLPDTGSLRGDLVAMIRPQTIGAGQKKMRVMAGVASMLALSPELAEAARAAIAAPAIAMQRIFLQRAIDRGEIAPDLPVDTLAVVVHAMTTYRALMLGLPVDREFLLGVIDEVLLPAVGLARVS